MPMIVCEFCKQHPATLHLTEIANGVKRELHFCARCAQQKGVTFQTHFNLPSVAAEAVPPAQEEKSRRAGPQCPSCGMTYADFQKVRRLGCPEDYVLFRKYLLPFIEQIHGSVKHVGKFPSRSGGGVARPDNSRQLADLRTALNRAIEKEEYEKAAQLRDQIRKLEDQVHQQG